MSELRPRRALPEKRVLFLIATAAVLAASFPMFFGALMTPEGAVFLRSNYPWDSNQYFAFMRVGFNGDWLFTNLLTSEEHPRILLMPFFVALGRVARLWRELSGGTAENGGSLAWRFIPLTYHLSRMVLTFLLAWALYVLVVQITPHRARRLWMVAVALFAGGWGSAEYLMTESHTLTSCLQFPHFSASLCLYVLSGASFLAAMKRDWRPKERRDAGARFVFSWGAVAAFCGFGLAWLHPFDLPPLGLLLGCVFGLSWWRLRRFPTRLFMVGALFLSFAALPSVYQWWVSRSHPVFQAIHASNVMRWTKPFQVFTELEVLLAFGLLGTWTLFRRGRRPENLFLAVWAISGFAILFVPFSFQRRQIEGLPIVLALASFPFVEGFVVQPLSRMRRRLPFLCRRRAFRRLRHAAWAVLLIALLPKTIDTLHHKGFAYFTIPNDYLYLPAKELEALEWLEANGSPDQAVWSARWRGNRLPFVSGLRAFVGHGVMTAEYDAKQLWTRELFEMRMEAAEFWRLVRQYRVGYLMWIQTDAQAMGADFDPGRVDPRLREALVFENSLAKIWRLTEPE